MQRIAWIFGIAIVAGCSSNSGDDGSGQGGNQPGNGGSSESSGGSMSASGGLANGGTGNGGTGHGGSANGGIANGGTGNGGSANGGTANGGAANGGSGNGGKANGASGGTANGASGGTTNGGKASGGASSGGANTAGTSGSGTGSGGGAHTNPLTQAQIDAFVMAHNQARSGTLNPPPSPALPPVTWDATLADVAYNYLSKCMGTDLADHNANRTKDYAALGGTDYVGENIYASSGKAASPADAVNSWMSEASKFDYNNPNLSAAGHYTQVVWRASVRIGCAIVTCPSLKYPNNILCDYAPGGNITGQKPY